MAFEGLVIPHPRNFTSATSSNSDGTWTVSRDIGDYKGYEAYKAFNNNSNRSLASGGQVNRLILVAPKTFLWAGCRIEVGWGVQCAGNISIEVSTNGGSTWTEAAASSISTSDTFKNIEFGAMSGNAICVHWTTASYGDVSEVIFYAAQAQVIKFLVKDTDGALKSYSGGTWTTIKASGDPVEADFAASAITDSNISSIPKSGWAQLGKGNIEVLMRAATGTIKSTKVSFIPNSRMIMPNSDIVLDGIDNIDNFSLTTTLGGSGNIRVVVSNDSGTTWYRWNGSIFDPIDISNLSNVATLGMTPSALLSIPSLEWNIFLMTNKIVRFAFYISVSNLSDVAIIDKLNSQFDLTGTWMEAIKGTDYDVEWGNHFLRVKLKATGNWKINHGNQIVMA